MTLDEAIKHANEVAQEQYTQGILCHANPNDEKLDKCIACAREHEQLAEWLEELKISRIALEKANGYLEANWKLGYNKAIDDFIDTLEYDFGTDDEVVVEMYDLRKVAERLKESKEDED